MDLCENSSRVLQKALAGDSQAWDALFALLWPVAAKVAASVLKGRGGAAMVEDIAQNVFVRLTADDAGRLRRFDPGRGMLESYVARIAHSCAVDYLRSNAKHFGNADISALPEIGRDAPDPLPMVEEWELLAALAVLTPRERQVVDLLYRDGLDTPEAARRLKVTPETVRSEKSHALRKLKKFFGQG